MRINTGFIRTILLLSTILLILSSCSLIRTHNVDILSGTADVSGLDSQYITSLDGEWEFYPDLFLIPGDIKISSSAKTMIKVPSVWKGNPPGRGYGTYRLVLTGLEQGKRYSFYFFEKVSAASYYIDTTFMGGDGIPGKSKNTEIPDFIPSLHSFSAKGQSAVLMIQVSNFSMKNGGLWESVRFGEAKTVHRYWALRIILLSIIIGAMITMGIYQVFLFLLYKEALATLWLSLTIGLVVVKTMITGEHILMRFLPGISQIFLLKLSTMSVVFMIPFYLMFLHKSFPGICSTKVLKVNFMVSSFYAALIVFLSFLSMQSVIEFYLWFIIINLIYIILIIIRAVREKRPGAKWSLIASILILSFALNDILYDMHIIQTGYTLNLGLLIFLMLQAFLTADQNIMAYSELKLLRSKLEAEVENRTEELKEERNKLEILARNDTLTGLFNRNSSSDIFEREILRYQRTRVPFAVVMIDLDYFKAINDSYGHAAGDYALQELGKAIRDISRRTDYCFRWGGEEFLLLLPDTKEADARIHAEKLRQNIADSPEAGEQSFYLTLSYGISSIYDPGEKSVDIVNRADTALYRAKEEGRNRGYIYKKPTNS
ncbi:MULTISPECIES: diguanylate cyclase [unclassified Oceanispirochaeta]|uniref:sensor domain-containing diguanylate cyclase n=1 Tax=unclassified Oceanispirochaeta TaxID=2635722 RepID=UPI000E099BCF|nr:MULTISPECIES: diguanylate cyclase [unclassified Oceanispirochaeta]MBF9015410.1 diguanylate cyclase [Oceanispirochaeta sp. M2]NPD71869.1 diguanylate cyclase [Oceanispirochaeta sp. M1]RDG32678.1 diguanylate cyclase [Oceanispirochaeta sp. M1]